MTEQVFTVFDSAAKRYLQPFFSPSIEFALRQFRHTLNDEEHLFARFPEDYTLFHIGEYDAETGMITSLPNPHSLGVAITMIPTTNGQIKAVNDG